MAVPVAKISHGILSSVESLLFYNITFAPRAPIAKINKAFLVYWITLNNVGVSFQRNKHLIYS